VPWTICPRLQAPRAPSAWPLPQAAEQRAGDTPNPKRHGHPPSSSLEIPPAGTVNLCPTGFKNCG